MSKGPRRFGHVEGIALIGGGDLMRQTARMMRKSGLQTTIVLAPRHAEEALPLASGPAKKAFADDGSAVHVVQDINAWPELESLDWAGANSLALCFGSPWIFGEHVLARFGAGMINFNGIPIPRYLGGAHYTWQILNGDRTGGCLLQEITMDVDRGPVLRRHLFDLPAGVRLPEDYFLANYEEGCRFMEQVIGDIRADKAFEPIEFSCLTSDRSTTKTRSGVGRGNRRQGDCDTRGVSGWQEKRPNGLPRAGRLPKSCHRMAAMGTEFPWRWGRGTIFANLDVIWGMSAKGFRKNS